MIAYIGAGTAAYAHYDTTADASVYTYTATCAICTDTTPTANSAVGHTHYLRTCTLIERECDKSFLYDGRMPIQALPGVYYSEPWKVPAFHDPAPIKIVAHSAQTQRPLFHVKQPRARTGFKRGQRT